MKSFNPIYNQIPKAEIHCHLEGSIRTKTIIDIANQYHLRLPAYTVEDLDQYVKVYDQLKDLQSVLDAFSIAQNSFTSPDVVKRIADELFEDAAKQNIRLLEVRFSPDWAFSAHDVNWDAALESLLEAAEKAEQQYDMVVGLVVISSRGLGVQSCEKTVTWAIQHKDVIGGIDLADGERLHPISEFAHQVWRAKEAGLRITIHSGEDTPAYTVTDTILMVQPDRIGHGIHIIEDLNAIQLVKDNNLTLETNPWSNYLTHSVERIQDHPLKRLFDLGVKVTINSDDPELLNTNLNNEYRIAHEILGMSFDEISACNQWAVQAAFIPEHKKQALLEKFFS